MPPIGREDEHPLLLQPGEERGHEILPHLVEPQVILSEVGLPELARQDVQGAHTTVVGALQKGRHGLGDRSIDARELDEARRGRGGGGHRV